MSCRDGNYGGGRFSSRSGGRNGSRCGGGAVRGHSHTHLDIVGAGGISGVVGVVLTAAAIVVQVDRVLV